MNETIAIGSRHIVVDLGDNIAGTLGGGQRGVHANAKTAIAVRIRRRNFNQRHVNGHGAAFKERFNLTQINRSVVGSAFVDGLSHIRADKIALCRKCPAISGAT